MDQEPQKLRGIPWGSIYDPRDPDKDTVRNTGTSDIKKNLQKPAKVRHKMTYLNEECGNQQRVHELVHCSQAGKILFDTKYLCIQIKLKLLNCNAQHSCFKIK